MQKVRDNPNFGERPRERPRPRQNEGPRARLPRRRRRRGGGGEADAVGQARRDEPGVELHDAVRRERVDGGELQHHARRQALLQAQARRPLHRRDPHSGQGALRLRQGRRRQRRRLFPGAEGLRQLPGYAQVLLQIRGEDHDR